MGDEPCPIGTQVTEKVNMYFDAINAGDLSTMERFLEQDQSYLHAKDCRDTDWGTLYPFKGCSAIHYAAMEENGPCLELLLQKGAVLDAADVSGYTALMWAAKTGNETCLKLLLDKGANAEAKDKNEYTALIWAARNGKEVCVQRLLDFGADKEAKDSSEYTALINAAINGHETCLSALISAGADKEARDKNGRSALMFAAYWGEVVCVDSLLQSKANKDAKENKGETALMKAAANGKTDCMQVLLAARAEKEAKDKTGLTALMHAARRGKTGCLESLLQAKANTDAQDNQGETALMKAVEEGDEGCLQILLAAGCDKDCADKNNKTALMKRHPMKSEVDYKVFVQWAAPALFDDAKIFGTIIELSTTDFFRVGWENGRATWVSRDDIWLARSGYIAQKSTISPPQNSGPYIDFMDRSGKTALMKAASLGRLSTCRMLIQFGATVSFTNPQGKTALLLAKMGANLEVACDLVQKDDTFSEARKDTELRQLSQGCFRELWVCKKASFLLMVRLIDFEEAKEKGYIIVYPGNGKILFCSHRWLGSLQTPAHPDNYDNIKQNAIMKAVTTHSDFSDVEFIWIDFTCVPQHNALEQQLAINSLPFIVQQCSHFLVLLGESKVQDKQGKDEASLEVYKSRGWCRLECISAHLARDLKRWVCNINTGVIDELDKLGGVSDLADLNPFEGNFFEMEDRRKIAPMVFNLVHHLNASEIKASAFQHLRLDAQQRLHEAPDSGCSEFLVAEMTKFDLVKEHIKISRSFV